MHTQAGHVRNPVDAGKCVLGKPEYQRQRPIEASGDQLQGKLQATNAYVAVSGELHVQMQPGEV